MLISLFKKNKKEKLPARQRGNRCLNCEELLTGEENFCPECGQRNNTNQLTFKLFLDEFIGNLFTYDSQVWRTIVPLILKPGKVAHQFISGKRKKFVNPFRTYLTVSLIFFVIYGLLNTINEYRGKETDTMAFNFSLGDDKEWTKAQKDSIVDAALAGVEKNAKINIDSTLRANNVPLDSIRNEILKDSTDEGSLLFNSSNKKIQEFWVFHRKHKDLAIEEALDSMGYENTFWNRFYYDKARDTQNMMDDGGKEFNDRLFSGLSLAIFIFLPLFALFLKLIYIRRKYTYMEHMVFVFYTQTVFFLLMLLFVIINFFIEDGSTNLMLISVGVFAIYLLLGMKYFYKQGWLKTIFKYVLANFSFMVMAVIGFTILALVAFFFN